MRSWQRSARFTRRSPMPPSASDLARQKAAQAEKFNSKTETGLGDALGGEPKPATVAQQAPERSQEPAQADQALPAYRDAEGIIHARKGSRRAGDAPENEIDFRAWRAKGRNAPIHTKVRPEFRRMFYQGAANEEKELCVVLEEMILARYGRKK